MKKGAWINDEVKNREMSKASRRGKTAQGIFWKVLERFSVLGVQFVLQTILARQLVPEYYGMLSIMTIFIGIANVFVQSGFNTALIQSKNIEEKDYSSVFWLSLSIAILFYMIVFFAAPFIGEYYRMKEIVVPLRVLGLTLFPGTLNSVQLAKVSREMNFRNVFFSNIGATIVSGVAGIIIAYMGDGLWALVIQNILHMIIVCLIMCFTVKLKIYIHFNLNRLKVFFKYGWKLLVSSLLETLYQDLRSLVIGKKYDSGTLGFYNRGKQFPQYIINAVNEAVKSVVLPIVSAKQDDKEKVKSMIHVSVSISTYIIFPMMAGLAACAPSIVELLLTEKWLPCVPYMQIYCFTLAFYPVHSCNLQAINAIGRSDIFLKLEIIKKIYGIVFLIIAVFCFDSPIMIAMTGGITTIISCFVNASPNKKLCGYSYYEQMKDILPALLLSVVMCVCVYSIRLLGFGCVLTLLIQVPTGVLIYILGSKVLHLDSFEYVLAMGKSLLTKRKKA